MIDCKDEHILNVINYPEDLRKLPQEKLGEVCEELRQYIIDILSENPGHLGASLGTVELTVALHYVFNTPYDRIVWDVGHQAYGHKILTGRREAFHTLRKFKGISGFPNPGESEYDAFIAGHASNSISAAMGMSVAFGTEGGTRPPRNSRDRRRGNDRRTGLRRAEQCLCQPQQPADYPQRQRYGY